MLGVGLSQVEPWTKRADRRTTCLKLKLLVSAVWTSDSELNMGVYENEGYLILVAYNKDPTI